VVGDVGLARAGLLDEVTVAQLLARQQVDDLTPERIGEHAQGVTLD
jgi:hypothetical protein